MSLTPLSDAEFAGLIERLGPFEPAPHLAVAVSGGADSMALALLAAAWVDQRGGRITGLVVDHGLRPLSAAEAQLACDRLSQRGIPSRLLRLSDLSHGPGLAARARISRHAALRDACGEAGILHLLLGHHAADQSETLQIRRLSHSGPAGLAGMAALAELPMVRLLRPLLGVPPGRLRATLRHAGQPWTEDPSNRDLRALRPRLRAERADPAGDGPATRDDWHEAAAHGADRARAEAAIADILARRADIRPEGFALLTPGPIATAALAALLRMLSGRDYPAAAAAVARLAASPAPATLAGVRLSPAGRLAPGHWLLQREAAAMQPEVPAVDGALWDRRFRLRGCPPPLASLGPLGRYAASLRHRSALPASVLQTLPAIRLAGNLLAVPHIGFWAGDAPSTVELRLEPAVPAAGAPFLRAVAEANWRPILAE